MKQLLYLIIALMMAMVANAMPPLPQEVYGTLYINGVVASSGQNISIYDVDGVLCGSHITRHEGIYGLVSCKGDDPDSPDDEGARNGEKILIVVNGREYDELEWQSSRFTNINISLDQKTRRFNASIKLPHLGEKEFALLVFLLTAITVLILCIIFLKKAIEK